jgi:hypothetical protein
MTLMTVGLSIANQIWAQILQVEGLCNPINACGQCMTREGQHIGSIWSRVTCLALPLASARSLARRASRCSQHRRRLMIATENKQLQTNK